MYVGVEIMSIVALIISTSPPTLEIFESNSRRKIINLLTIYDNEWVIKTFIYDLQKYINKK